MDKWAECLHVLNEAVLSDHGLNGLGRVPVWNTLRRDRPAVEKALRFFTPHVFEALGLFFRLYALGDNPQVHAAPKVDNRFRNCRVYPIRADVADERTIDLDTVYR